MRDARREILAGIFGVSLDERIRNEIKSQSGMEKKQRNREMERKLKRLAECFKTKSHHDGPVTRQTAVQTARIRQSNLDL